jgi:multisubunit Na+/H+ antiporter MnhF subunit
MNVWLAASVALCCGLIPCCAVCIYGDFGSALAALAVASVICVALLVTMTVGFERPAFIELAVVLAPMALIGSFAFVRFMERRR